LKKNYFIQNKSFFTNLSYYRKHTAYSTKPHF